MANESEHSSVRQEIIGMRSDLARYFDELNKVQKEQAERITTIEIVTARHDERIKTLTAQVKAWNISNSVGVFIAGIIGWFK